jgi:hypothetical protein
LEKKRDSLIDNIKESATKEDFDQIIKITDKVAEKHRNAPHKPLRRTTHPNSKEKPSTSTQSTWKDPNIQPKTNPIDGSQTKRPEITKDKDSFRKVATKCHKPL